MPVPTPAAEAPVAKAEEKPKPALTLIVGMQHANVFDNARIGGGALHSLEDRLDDHPGVKVAHLWGDITRSDAIRRAKSEKEAYVVLLELSLNRMVDVSDGEMRLSYSVFSPVTAKIKASGTTYARMRRSRGIILGPRTPNIYDDRQVQEASREAAERILKAFQLDLQNKRTAL